MAKKKKTIKKVPNLLATGEEEREERGAPKETPGEKESSDLSAEIDRNLKVAVAHVRELMEEQQEDIEFYLGRQWSEEDRAILEEQNRPCLTFNKIKPMIRLVVGHMLQNMARIQVSPEGGEDEVFSQVMDKAIDHIDKIANLNFKLGYLFSGAASAGRSWLEFHVDYNEDPIFGQLRIPYLGPFKVFMDPAGREYDCNEDCDYGFKVIKLSKSKLKQLYPDKAEQIDAIEEDTLNIAGNLVPSLEANPIEGDANNYGADLTKPDTGINQVSDPSEELIGDLRQLTTVEYWKKVYADKWFVYFTDDGSISEYDTEEEAKAEVARRRTVKFQGILGEFKSKLQPGQSVVEDQIPKEDQVTVDHIMKKSRVARMHVAVKAGDVVLTKDLEKSPFEPVYHGFPMFHSTAEWYPETEDPLYRIQGFVRSLKDPQREINKSRSQYLHILNTSANSGWIGDEDALSNEKWAELQQFGSTPGITIKKKKGSSLERIHPVEPSLAQNVREKAATDDMKEVSGINADLLSVDTSASPSGKAIALRIRQAVTILAPAFQNFKYTKILIGRFLLKILPTLMDEAKLAKILGKNFMEANGLSKPQLRAYLTIVQDGKYDISISEGGDIDTLREETFENLMTLVEKGMQLPPDVIFEFMNVPNKGEMLRKIEAFQEKQAALAQQQAAAGASAERR